MNDLPEHKRGFVAGLSDLDAEIDELEDRLIERKARRQDLVDAVARSVARYQINDEFEARRGRRFRITQIKGDYMATDLIPEPIVFVRYRGVEMYKKGTQSREGNVYPPEIKDGSAESEPNGVKTPSE